MSKQKFKVRPQIVDVNSDESAFFLHKFSGSCNNINDSWCCKNLNVRVFNLISATNETRLINWHESCKCKYRLDASVCNNKQTWN